MRRRPGYSAVVNIGDARSLEESPHELWHFLEAASWAKLAKDPAMRSMAGWPAEGSILSLDRSPLRGGGLATPARFMWLQMFSVGEASQRLRRAKLGGGASGGFSSGA